MIMSFFKLARSAHSDFYLQHCVLSATLSKYVHVDLQGLKEYLTI